MPAPSRPRQTFDQVWRDCEKQGKDGNARTKVVQLAEFLRKAGFGNKLPDQCVDSWTGKSGKLGLRENKHFWKQAWRFGRGTPERWVASMATLRRVWPALRRC